MSSTGALSLEQVPERMVVIGAGVIGLELVSWRGGEGEGVREVREKEGEEKTTGKRKGEVRKERQGERKEGRQGRSVEEGKEGKKEVVFWDDLPTVGLSLESSRVKGHSC